MGRPPRLEYPGAIYHVINRGNYRSDVFQSVGAAQAFVEVIEQAVGRFGWDLGAYVVMRNHYHLAVRTPEPNLSAGMHWLQTTFAARFNRLRSVHGHLFQGRYHGILLQDEEVWARVVDYIHLNPLRARVVEPALLPHFRWSSLARFIQGKRFKGLTAVDWLATLGLEDNPRGWSNYTEHLLQVYGNEQAVPETEREQWSKGWAIGSADWRCELVEAQQQQLSDPMRSEYVDPVDARERQWEIRLGELLRQHGRMEAELSAKGRGTGWKLEVADQMQRELGTSLVWLADRLHIARPGTLRTGLWRRRANVDK